MTRQLEESQIERIMIGLALECSTEVDPKTKKEVRETAYTFAYLITGNQKDRLRYIGIYETNLQRLEL